MTKDIEDTESEEFNLNSVYTTNLPEILKQMNISVAVSTYQSGKVILLRNDDGKINTHFRNFNRPMGIAVKPDRISIGCLNTIENYQNIPALIDKIEGSEKYDACYIPRNSQRTGAIDIHGMG